MTSALSVPSSVITASAASLACQAAVAHAETSDIRINVAVTDASGTLTAKESVLPQVGLGFKLNANNELFASYAENIAAFVGGGSGGPLQVSPESFAASAGTDISTRPKADVAKRSWRIRELLRCER